ncbi:hypothetical protein PanWU01x14_221560 [Parasponia andersonii]|uniref:Uncharacterized protein n=1 Tax=Parasponia andersonii TaxID=3476 RepID=A0A2P5BPD0_PARAD|nr:hypothetical protein PanWU01x14_221560 [Parasponia andersonii]
MGNCIPVLRIQDSASKSKCLSHVNTALGPIEMPIRDNSVSSQHQKPELCVKPHMASFREPSSREDMFFDSHAWLESDCEDYFSVNGDVTPSFNDTPMRKSRAGDTPQLDKSYHKDDPMNSLHKPSPNKLLIELFHESFSSDDHDENRSSHQRSEVKPSVCYLPSKSADKSSRSSVINNTKKRKATRPTTCCLPNLVRSVSLSERKKALNSA